MERKKRLEMIEKMIDEGSVAEVLEEVAEVCVLKAQHISENWHDKSLSREWFNMGKKIYDLSEKV